ncbi:MAG: tetratricopeptide repeat protein [Chromatiales bacterium]
MKRSIAIRRECLGGLRRRGRAVLRALVFGVTLIVANAALAADPDLARAEQLVREGKYQEAYDLLAPFKDARAGDPTFTYLLGRAALGTKRPDQAKALFERSLAARPDSVAAHLALGRAYYALGRYAEAKIEFETVLRFDNLPPDLLTQVEIYNQAAQQSLDEGRRLMSFGYAETGIGGYRVNSTRGTDAFGGGDRDNTFWNARVGGGLNYELDDGYALDTTLDYRFRYHFEDDIRNDSDWRWRAAGSRAFGENNLALGFRGRVSYRGDSIYRNDYSIFTNYRYRFDPDNQFTLGAEVQRRQYPDGRLSDRSRTTATGTAGWVRSLLDGRASFSLEGHGGYNFDTSRPDGDSAIFGATAELDFTFTDRLGGFIFAWYERDVFNTDRIHFHPDALDEGVILRRKDNLYEVGASLVWEFARGWTFRPEVLYIHDESNAVAFNYSSTEYWLNVRKGF